MGKWYTLKDFRFFIEDDRVEIYVADSRDRVWCSIDEARNVWTAIRCGELEHNKDKDVAQTLEEIRAFLNYEYLFEEYDNTRDADTVCVIMIRKDATAYIKKYTWNEWMCGTMLSRDLGWTARCSDGKLRNFDYE